MVVSSAITVKAAIEKLSDEHVQSGQTLPVFLKELRNRYNKRKAAAKNEPSIGK